MNKLIILNTKLLIYFALIGVILVITGVVLGFRIFPKLVENKVWENAVLKENTRQWELFRKIPFPFQIKINFFNVENVEEILQGTKPIVREVGPYIYKLFRWKDDIEWNGDEISYYDYMRFEFDKEASGKLSDEDFVTVLNSPFNALILIVEQISPTILSTVNEALPLIFKENNDIFIKARVKDLLFEGTTICENGSEEDFAARMICQQFKAKAKAAKTMTIVGKSISYSYLHFKNNTHLGRYTIKSGNGNREQVSNLIKYENKTHISVWGDDQNSVCNRIRGTTTFRPYVATNMTFEVFSEDICRSLEMEFEKIESVKGIPGYKYAASNTSLNAPEENSDNYCFCINKTRTLSGDYGCLGNGLLDLTNCVGAPVLLSFPHLLYADEEYRNSVEGLKPDKDLHDTFVVLEPISGTPLKMAKRVQFNMFLRAVEDIVSIENVTNSVIPIFWIEESMTLNDEYVNLLKASLFRNLKILEIIKWTLIGLGAIAVTLSSVLIIYTN